MGIAQHLYSSLLYLIFPPVWIWLALHPKHRPLLSRFSPPIPSLAQAPIWIHACSVGEVNTARPFLESLQQQDPESTLLLTTSTRSGQEQALRTCQPFPITWLPFDLPYTIRRFLRRVKPRVLVLIETEIWPNLLREANRANVPILVVNARLSDKHLHRYRRLRWFYRSIFSQLDVVGVQSALYAKRFEAMGVEQGRIHLTGNTKFDAVACTVSAKDRARLRQENGYEPDHRIFVFGSTRPGDEDLAAACWASLKDRDAGFRLIVAPRHLERLEEACSVFKESYIRRTEIVAGKRPGGARIMVLDTVGELCSFYALANIAVVGGSFFPGVNGHNPLEPTALGVATIFGPFMSNFTEPAQVLTQGRGAIQVSCPEQLEGAIHTLLDDPNEGRRMGTRARRIVIENQGAVERNIQLIRDHMQKG